MWRYDGVTQCVQHKHILAHTLMSLAGDVKDLSCLEVGCGNGDYMYQLYQRGARRVVGADLSAENIDLAKQKHQQNGVPQTVMDYCQADLTKPQVFGGGAFDVALCSCVVCYSENRSDLMGFMQTAYTNLKPGGQFVCLNTRIAMPKEIRDEHTQMTGIKYSVEPQIPYSTVAFEWPNGWKGAAFWVPTDELKSAMTEAGFEVTQMPLQTDSSYQGDMDLQRLVKLVPYDAFVGIKSQKQ